MDDNVIKMKFESNWYYLECFDNETIEDIKILLSKKYDFVNDKTLEIYQGDQKLHAEQMIKSLDNKDGLSIVGSIKTVNQKQEDETEKETVCRDYISEFRQMGFTQADETINKLLTKYNYKVDVVITQLLLSKSKKRNRAKSKK